MHIQIRPPVEFNPDRFCRK